MWQNAVHGFLFTIYITLSIVFSLPIIIQFTQFTDGVIMFCPISMYLWVLSIHVELRQLLQGFCWHIFVQGAGDELRECGEHQVEEDQVPLINHGWPREPTVELIPEDEGNEHLGWERERQKTIEGKKKVKDKKIKNNLQWGLQLLPHYKSCIFITSKMFLGPPQE